MPYHHQILTRDRNHGGTSFKPAPKPRGTWQEIASLPVCRSTCVSYRGNLLAVGGFDSNRRYASGDIFLYDHATNEWLVIGRIPTPRYNCLVEVVSGQLLVVGGWLDHYSQCDIVEIAALNFLRTTNYTTHSRSTH